MAVVAIAGSPMVTTIKPPGMQRGSERELKLSGLNLADAKGILTVDDRIKLVEIVKAESKKVTLNISTDPSMPPGLYPFWFVTESGVSNLRLLSIGAMPVIEESEPNSVFENAQALTLNSTVNGVVAREDVDYYRVDLKAGQRLNVEIEGIRLHRTVNNQNILDPYIAILDEGQFEVASSDDASLWQQDGFCTYQADADGTFTILVRDSSFLGHPSNGYRLHVGDFPRPMALYPSGGKPGQKLTAQMIMADGSVKSTQIDLPAEPVDQHPVITKNDRGESPSPNFVRVAEMESIIESEPNNAFDQAKPTAVPAAFHGAIEKDGDIDYFAINLKKGQKVRVRVFGRKVLRSKVDAVLNLYGPDKKRIGGADDSNGCPDPYAEVSAKANGLHYIRISDHLNLGSPLHHYRVEVTAAKPRLELTAKELRRDEAWNTVVPQGGHGLMVVSAKRMDHGGPVKLAVDGLPEEVHATTFEMPAGRVEVPIVFSCPKDAPTGVSLISIGGAEDAYETQYYQDTKLVLGQNRRHLWSHRMSRSPVIVTHSMPFEMEVIQPISPIVRQGSKSIKVKIKRNEGFKNTVSLRTAYRPPGISINNSRRFEKDATEIEIPITANSAAGLGKWPIVFVTRYADATGPWEVASNPIEIEVQDRFFEFKFPNATGELGTETKIAVELKVLRELPADAEVELVGLPKGVRSSAPIQPIKADQTVVTFPVTIAADAKPGMHKTLNCIGRVKTEGETIVQTVGTGRIRVDKPLPPKNHAEAKPKKTKPEPKPAPPKPARAKPLSRLEQLRQASGK